MHTQNQLLQVLPLWSQAEKSKGQVWTLVVKLADYQPANVQPGQVCEAQTEPNMGG